MGDELKFYFHCQLVDKSGYAFSELVFKQGTNQLTGSIKTTRSDLSPTIVKKFEDVLSAFTQ